MKSVKRIITITLTILLLLGIFSAPSNVLITHCNENDVVRVGFYKWDGFNNMDEEGNLSGYGYEYLEHLSRYNNWNYEFVGYDKTWQESMEMLKSGEIDILCSMIKTGEREREFLLSDSPMGSKKYTLTTLNNNNKYFLDDVEELNGIKVGVYKDNASNELFAEFAVKNNIQYTMVEAESSDEDQWLIESLKDGYIDAIFSSEYRIKEDEKILTSTGTTEFFIATNKSNNELMEELNRSMKELNSNEPLLATELTRKYFAKAQLGTPNFTRLENEYIESHKDSKILLSVSNLNRPFYWVDDEEQYGIYVNIVEKINELTGLNIKLTDNSEDAEGIIGVTSDLYLGRIQGLEVTDPVIEYNYAEVYYDGYDFKKLGTIKHHDETLENIEQIYSEPVLIVFENFDECAYAIEHRNIEGIFVDEYSAQVIINQIYSNSININIYNYENLKAKESIGVYENGSKELLTFINKWIDPWVINSTGESMGGLLYEATDDYNSYDFWTSYRQAISVFSVMLIITLLIIKKIWRINSDRLEKKNEELSRANSAKSDFLGRMSHDMRTPMNAIIGMSEFGMEEVDDNNAKEYFGNINHSSKYLLSLLNDVLDLQRIEQGAIELQKDWADFSEGYEMIANILKDRIKEKNLNVDVEIDSKLNNALVYTDTVRYRQIMLNLINNSIKYTPKGGNIRVSISIRELNGKPILVNMISDDGVGMSEEFMNSMYDRFAQEKNSESKEEGGTGLGLSITKSLVELMGGNIKCNSALGEGTTFTVTLPTEVSEKDDTNLNDDLKTNLLEGKTILLCEDNKTNAVITEKLLKKVGINVEFAKNGREGIEKAKSFKYDAILMDIRMPEVDGLKAAEAIRAFDKVVPIIALSANAYAEDVEKSLKAGMQSHIAKPINRDELYRVLIKWTNKNDGLH